MPDFANLTTKEREALEGKRFKLISSGDHTIEPVPNGSTGRIDRAFAWGNFGRTIIRVTWDPSVNRFQDLVLPDDKIELKEN